VKIFSTGTRKGGKVKIIDKQLRNHDGSVNEDEKKNLSEIKARKLDIEAK